MTSRWAYVIGIVPDWLSVDGYADKNGCERAEVRQENVVMPITEWADFRLLFVPQLKEIVR